MINKILVFWWISVAAVLIVANAVSKTTAYLFITFSPTWKVVFAWVLIWVVIWFWLSWMLNWKTNETNDDDIDF